MLEIVGMALIVAGILLVFYGLFGGMEELKEFEEPEEIEEIVEKRDEEVERRAEKKVKSGGVVIIGPIPIVFGDSKYAVLALTLSILLMILILTIMVLNFIYT